ncbi:hypothetical protein ACIA74_09560 [Streptomyces sp. NPDC051658]|uniref:hypothetical protein n=1 Tax=Streptomyces sp. NPDC051658 TaxID=3365667 RepID=UPI0037B591DC
MSKQAGEVAVVEGFVLIVLQLIDRAGKGDLLGDGRVVGPDEVDPGVIGAGPVAAFGYRSAADRFGDRGGDRRGSPDWVAGLPFGQGRSHFTWRLTWFRKPRRSGESLLLGLAAFLYEGCVSPGDTR